ncbi:LysR family transcriptional regulator [Azospirillum halopraeferens]|uniref:LysR family transcriptional regulator n=1 Tax=Azospirillum halopraeferens TaxID=34010 RepID=UPI000426D60F|nr:LysR family transcriptional regulator [Azospirillum halopraeferens]
MIQGLRHIKAFLAVARTGNFTKAAAELHVSQPALTVQIRQLEEALGVKLFDRNKRQVMLTEAGKDLMPPLQRVLVDLEAVMNSSHDLAGLKRGTVTVATLPSVAAGLLPRVIRRFTAEYPGIRIQVVDVVADHIVRLVRSEEVDFGVGPRVRPEREIEFTDLLTDSMCAFFPANHPLRTSGALTLRDVAKHPLILTARDSSVRALVDRALEKDGLAVNLVCEANYMSTAIGMVRAGLGVSILPESAIDSASCEGVSMMPIRTPGLTRKIGVIRKNGRTLSPAPARFLDILRGAVREPVPHFGSVPSA